MFACEHQLYRIHGLCSEMQNRIRQIASSNPVSIDLSQFFLAALKHSTDKNANRKTRNKKIDEEERALEKNHV